jgi:hypothetical protein
MIGSKAACRLLAPALQGLAAAEYKREGVGKNHPYHPTSNRKAKAIHFLFARTRIEFNPRKYFYIEDAKTSLSEALKPSIWLLIPKRCLVIDIALILNTGAQRGLCHFRSVTSIRLSQVMICHGSLEKFQRQNTEVLDHVHEFFRSEIIHIA